MTFLDQPSASATTPFDLSDRGLTLADGVFDTSYVRNGHVLFQQQHTARLMRDAAALNLSVTPERIAAAAQSVLPSNGDGVLRLTLTRGAGARGLKLSPSEATVLAQFHPGDPGRAFTPQTLAPVAIRRNETSPSARHKTLAYLDNIFALDEATKAGATDALMLNTQGRVACCSAANIFAIHGATLITPAIGEGALPGIIRAWVLANAHRAGLKAEERLLTHAEARGADALFATSSLLLIAPASLQPAQRKDHPAIAALTALARELL